MSYEQIPLMEISPENDYDCFVWAGVVAKITTNEQTLAFFANAFEEIGESLDELSIARGKKEILKIVDQLYKE
tara:strand:+ start:2007 stop:2225 length:219 start_codon:yes stop_codon:yes gene_type:complete